MLIFRETSLPVSLKKPGMLSQDIVIFYLTHTSYLRFSCAIVVNFLFLSFASMKGYISPKTIQRICLSGLSHCLAPALKL